jgi:RimJ/RimL family protein N-acetyltransferase
VSIRLETARLVVRTFESRDAEPWLAMMTDPDVRRFLTPGPLPTLETFESAVEQRHALEREHCYAVWAVDDRETGSFVGQCGLQLVARDSQEAELVYHFTKASWNKGYATEAAIAVLAHAFGAARLDRVIVLVLPENVGSCRVAEKAGMRFEGTTNAYRDLPDLRKYGAEREWWGSPLEGRR